MTDVEEAVFLKSFSQSHCSERECIFAGEGADNEQKAKVADF